MGSIPVTPTMGKHNLPHLFVRSLHGYPADEYQVYWKCWYDIDRGESWGYGLRFLWADKIAAEYDVSPGMDFEEWWSGMDIATVKQYLHMLHMFRDCINLKYMVLKEAPGKLARIDAIELKRVYVSVED